MEIDDQRVVARAVRSVRPLRTGFIAGMRLGTLTVLTATLVSCGSAAQRSQTAPGQSSQSGTPDSRRPGAHRGAAKTDVAAMFQREASGLTDKSVRAADGRWTAVVPAAADPTQKADGSVAVVQIPIGAEGPVQCQVHSTRIDAGGALAGVLGAASQKVKFESIVPWAVTIVGTTPAAWIEAVYVVEKPEGKAAGHLKLAVLAQNDNSLFCLHDGPGFKVTFERVAGAFFQSFKPAKQSPSPRYLEVRTASIKNHKIGFAVTTLTGDAKPGRQRWSTVSLIMIPRAANQVVFQDNYDIYVTEAKRLISGHLVEAEGGRITQNIKFESEQGPTYQYSGEIQGKPVKGTFRTQSPDGLQSERATAEELKKNFAKSNAFSLKREAYNPKENLSATSLVTYRHEAGEPPWTARVKMGDLDTTAVFDEDGMTKDVRIPLGDIDLELKRELKKGKL